MKPRTILACFFAAFGLYFTLNALFAVSFIIYGLISMPALYGDSMNSLRAFTLLPLLIPLILGVLILTQARRLGALCARFAGVPPDAEWNLNVNARELCALLLAALGVYLLIVNGAQCIRLLLVLFISKAGSPNVAEAAARGVGSDVDIIVFIILTIAGVVLVKQSRRIAAALGFSS